MSEACAVRVAKVLLVSVAVLALAFVAAREALVHYDQKTRQELLALAAQEVPTGASLGEMEVFLKRHTTRYALDDTFNHTYGGFLPQTDLDKRLCNRQVQINLKFDAQHKYAGAEVNIYYTSL